MVLGVLLPLALLIALGLSVVSGRVASAQASLLEEFAKQGVALGCSAAQTDWSRELAPGVLAFGFDRETLDSSAPHAPVLSKPMRDAFHNGATSFVEAGDKLLGGGRFGVRLNGPPSCGLLIVEWAPRDQSMRLSLIFFVTALACCIPAFLGFFWVVIPLLRRLQALSRLATQVGTSVLSAELPSERDEIGLIEIALRKASAQIETDRAALLEKNQSLERFLLELGHDLKTPLAALTLSIDELTSSPHVSREAAQSAWAEVVYVGQLVENLRFEARMRQSFLVSEPQRFDLAELVENTVARIRPLANQAQVSLEQLFPETPVWVLADRTFIERGISNLVHNAVTHGARHVAVRLSTESGQFTLSIDDDGPGLNKTVSSRRGEGLGAHIAKTALSQNGFSLQLVALSPSGLSAQVQGQLNGA
jgi:signal transduction histidine kinase